MKKILFLGIFIIQTIVVFGQTELEQAQSFFNLGTTEGYKSAISIYSKNETKLSHSQINTLGFSYWKLEDYKLALRYFELAAAKGDETGKFNSGYNYFYGNGTEVDYQKAYNYLARVGDAYNSNPETLHMLGHCLEAGADLHGTLGKPIIGALEPILYQLQKRDILNLWYILLIIITIAVKLKQTMMKQRGGTQKLPNWGMIMHVQNLYH